MEQNVTGFKRLDVVVWDSGSGFDVGFYLGDGVMMNTHLMWIFYGAGRGAVSHDIDKISLWTDELQEQLYNKYQSTGPSDEGIERALTEFKTLHGEGEDAEFISFNGRQLFWSDKVAHDNETLNNLFTTKKNFDHFKRMIEDGVDGSGNPISDDTRQRLKDSMSNRTFQTGQRLYFEVVVTNPFMAMDLWTWFYANSKFGLSEKELGKEKFEAFGVRMESLHFVSPTTFNYEEKTILARAAEILKQKTT